MLQKEVDCEAFLFWRNIVKARQHSTNRKRGRGMLQQEPNRSAAGAKEHPINLPLSFQEVRCPAPKSQGAQAGICTTESVDD